MATKKIVCLGGGSLYFPGAVGDLVSLKDLAGSEIVLYDIDGEKAERMSALGQRLSEKAGNGTRVRSTIDLADAVDGADYAISSIGGSGAERSRDVYGSYYHSTDMHIPAAYGIHQVIGDTCGPAGMMMGLRAVPAYIRICEELERRAPKAFLFSHSNPMAILCRAMNKYTGAKVIGICHGVQGAIAHFARILGLPPQELECAWIGTNHYYWFTQALHEGKDVYPELQRRLAERKDEEGWCLTHRLSAAYGYAVAYDDAHLFEFYPFAAQVRSQGELSFRLAAEAVKHGFDENKPMSAKPEATERLHAEFMGNYQAILDRCERDYAKAMGQKGMAADHAQAEELAGIIAAIDQGVQKSCIVNIQNGGLIPNLPSEAVVEVKGETGATGVRGLSVGECPPVLKGILEKRFAWQELVVDAAAKGDRRLALQALLLDEMAVVPEKAEKMLAELLEASRDLLPQFFK